MSGIGFKLDENKRFADFLSRKDKDLSNTQTVSRITTNRLPGHYRHCVALPHLGNCYLGVGEQIEK